MARSQKGDGRPGAGPTATARGRKPRGQYVVRLGVSLEPDLLTLLDRWVRERNSPSRSEAIRALIRKELAEHELGDPNSDSVASVLLIYRHDAPNVLRRLTAVEHRWGAHVRSSSHVHLEGGSCMQLIGLAGRRDEVVNAAEDLRGVKGIAYGRYSLGTPTVAGGTTGHRHPHRGKGAAPGSNA
jgi:CopG family transcriptional regulator, nickel-responsive regulator